MATVEMVRSAVHAMFRDQEWKYSFDEEDGIFQASFGLGTAKLDKVQVLMDVCGPRRSEDPNDECRFVIAFGKCGVRADENCMAQVAEYLTRANFGLSNGNFELDYRDGEIRYKVFISCRDMLPSAAVLREAVILPVDMFDRYGNGLLAVLLGVRTPEEAIREAED